jgi:hypothetical protein
MMVRSLVERRARYEVNLALRERLMTTVECDRQLTALREQLRTDALSRGFPPA